jgi:hypothetical protein
VSHLVVDRLQTMHRSQSLYYTTHYMRMDCFKNEALVWLDRRTRNRNLFIFLRKLMARHAARNPRQVPAQNVNGNSRNHKDCASPKAPVTMHTPPVRAWIRLATIAAISFAVVFASGHLFSVFRISEQCSCEILFEANIHRFRTLRYSLLFLCRLRSDLSRAFGIRYW